MFERCAITYQKQLCFVLMHSIITLSEVQRSDCNSISFNLAKRSFLEAAAWNDIVKHNLLEFLKLNEVFN